MYKEDFDIQLFAFNGGTSRDNYSNATANNVVSGNGGNDSLENSADDATLSGGKGADTLKNIFDDNNGGDGVSLFGGAGNDFIQNSGGYDVSIDGGDDADTIENSNGHDAYINGGKGNDSIISRNANNLTVLGGSDSDTIEIYRSKNSKIDGGDGNDLISLKSSAGTMTVIGGKGNDIIYGDTRKNVIYQYAQGDGDDTIYNYKSTDKISLDGGYYTRETLGNDVVISLTSGGAITLDGASNKTINITGGIQTIISNVINLTSGDDKRANYTSNATINALEGDDSIENRANSVVINGGNGSDSIWTNGSKNTINGDADNDYIYVWTSGKSLQINSGDGKDSLHIAGTNSTVNAGSGDDFIQLYTEAENNTIYADSGNDTIYLGKNSIVAYGDIGDDYIYVYSDATNQTVYGGSGNDSIYSGGQNVFISGGANNDYIHLYNEAKSTTVNAGYGNDTIQNYSTSGILYQFYGETSNDIIYGYNAKDTISLGGGYYTRSTVGTNVVVSLESGTITLDSASGKTVNIVGGTLTVEGGKNITNTSSNTLISGTSYNDTITNKGGNKVTISTGGGADTIYNSLSSHKDKSYVSIVSGDGNDSIYNYLGSAATILAGAGKDTIYDSSWYTFINAGEDDDSINTGSSYDTIDGGNDNDVIQSGGYYVSINGGAGNDRISLKSGDYSDSAKKTVKGGAGNDLISIGSGAGGNIFQFASGDGNDTIYGYTSYDTISLGGGYYTRETTSSGDVVVSLTSGGAITLTGASGKTVNIVGGTLTVDGGSGQNIKNTVSGAKITTGAGNDTISNDHSDSVQISSGSGNDSIFSNGSTQVTIWAGDGNDTIQNWGNRTSIDAETGNDSLWSSNNYATVNMGAGQDTISGHHYTSYLNGGDDNDLVSITSYSYNTVDGGKGDDTITVGVVVEGKTSINAYGISINGGEGADNISLRGFSSTVTGGTGNDAITLSGNNHLIQYNKGDGNDIIYGYDSSDSITINGGSKWTKSNSGNDVVIKVANSGNITLVGAKGKTLNIFPANNYVEEYTPQDVILKFMKALDDTNNIGETAMDDAVKACSNYDDFQDLINKLCKELKIYLEKDPVNGWKTFLEEKCDIILEGTTNEDTGAITGKDAGGSKVKTAESVISEPNNRNTGFNKDSFTTNGVTFKIGEYNKYTEKMDEKSFTDLKSNDEIFVWQSIYSNWAKQGLDLINESYGYSFADEEFKCNTIYIYFDYDTSALAWTNYYHYYIATNQAADLMIGINMNVYKNFSNSDENGVGYTINNRGNTVYQEYLDRTFTHEMVHAIMMSKIKQFRNLTLSVIEGTAELVKGIDDTRPRTIEYMAKNVEYLRHCMGYEYTWQEYKEGGDEVYGAGYIMLRYLAKQASNGGDKNVLASAIHSNDDTPGVSVSGAVIKLTKDFKEKSLDFANYYGNVTKLDASTLTSGVVVYANSNANSLKGGKGADMIFAGYGKDTVLGGNGADALYGEKDDDLLKGDAGNDTLYGGGGNDTLYGGTNNDVLYGNADNDKLYGDAGDDTLDGGAGNDSLTGGKGADVFVYKLGEGNDTITDYTAKDKDKIQIVNGTITGTRTSGKDIIYTIGNNTLTVKNGVSQNISIEYVDESRVYSRWFTDDDDNFISAENNLDDISKVTTDNYSAGDIKTVDYSALAQNNRNFISYGAKK